MPKPEPLAYVTAIIHERADRDLRILDVEDQGTLSRATVAAAAQNESLHHVGMTMRGFRCVVLALVNPEDVHDAGS